MAVEKIRDQLKDAITPKIHGEDVTRVRYPDEFLLGRSQAVERALRGLSGNAVVLARLDHQCRRLHVRQDVDRAGDRRPERA